MKKYLILTLLILLIPIVAFAGRWDTTGNILYSMTFGSETSFTSTDTSPSVVNETNFVTANGSATTIDDFDDGKIGQTIFVRVGDANTTFDFTSSNLNGNSGSDYSASQNDLLMFYTPDGTNWYATFLGGSGSSIEDAAYGSGWDSDTTHGPSQNAVYDILHTYDTDDDGDIDNIDGAVGGGDITGVGPGGTGAGDALTDGYQTQNTTSMFIWEGPTDDGVEYLFVLPAADPVTADTTWTYPSESGTFIVGEADGYADNTVLAIDGGGGHLTQETAVTIDDSNNMGGIGTLTASGVVDFTDTTEASAIGTAALITDGGASVAKDIWIGDDIVLDSDSAVIHLGADQDIKITHTADQGITVFEGTEEILILKDGGSGSATNEITILSAATTASPTIQQTGEDDIGIDFETVNDEEMLQLDAVAAGTNNLKISNAANSSSPSITAVGSSDANVGINIDAKAAGEIVIGSADAKFSLVSDALDIDNSGNISNAGTIGSGAITSTGAVEGTSVTDGTITLVGDGTITGIAEGGLPDSVVVAADIKDGTITENDLTASLVFDEGDLLDMSITQTDGTDEGIAIPTCDDPASVTPSSDIPFICWDSDDNEFNIYDGGWVSIVPTGAPVTAKYVVFDALHGSLTAEMLLAESTDGIDLSSYAADGTLTVSFDASEVNAETWGDGTNASNVWTFDVSGTDHTMTLGNGLVTFGDAVTVTDTLTGSATIVAATSFLPDESDGATVGDADNEISDIYLADGGIIYGQDDQSNTLTSSATDWTFGLDITVSGGNINTGNIALTIGDSTTDSITLLTDGTGEGEVEFPNDSIGDEEIDWSDVTAADITMTDAGNITSSGTITAAVGFDVTGAADMDLGSADVLDITLVENGGTYIFDNGLSAAGEDLGSATAEWGDFYIADDKTIKMGSDQDTTLGYDETTDDRVELSTTLSAGTGDEEAFAIIYTTNKATSGNDTGLLISMTDTASPGTSYLIDAQVGGTSVFAVRSDGAIITAASEDPAVILNEYTGGDTDYWFGLNADQEGDDDDYFEIGTGLTAGSNTKWQLDNSGNVINSGTQTSTSLILEGGTYDTTITPGTPTESVSYQWPLADGTTGQVLATNASGTLSWTTVTATPAGANYYIQWNNGTAMDGESAFTYNDDNNTMNVTQSASNPCITTGDGTYTIGHTAQVYVEGVLEADGITYADGGLTIGEDIDINLDAADEEIAIDQSAVAGTEDVGLIKINDDRTGDTATEQSEATIWIDAEGVFAISAVDGAISAEGGFFPAVSDGAALGSDALDFSDLWLADGGKIDFDSGDVTITHGSDTLAFAGATSSYTFDDAVDITGSDGLILSNDETITNASDGTVVIGDGTNEIAKFTTVGSAANELTFFPATTGNNPTIQATGEADTGIDIENSESEEGLTIDFNATATNNLVIDNAANGSSPTITAVGSSDANVGIGIDAKAAGEIAIGSADAKFSVTSDALDISNAGAITGCTGLTITTGNALTVGSNQWDDGSDKIDGEQVADDTIDNDSIDWGDMTDLTTDGAVVWGNIAAGELADDSVVAADIDDDGNFTDWTGNWTFATGTFTLSNGAVLGGDLSAASGNNSLDITADTDANDTLKLIVNDTDDGNLEALVATAGASPTLVLASTGNGSFISSAGTITIESVVFTGAAISGVSTLATTDDITIAAADPDIVLDDTDGADGFIQVAASDADDAVITMGVDDSGGDDQTYITLDGVGEEVELNQKVRIGDGTATDFTITIDASTADGVITWDEDPGEWDFAADIKTSEDIVIGDAKYIGSASDTDAIAIAANGVVTFSQDVVFASDSIVDADIDDDGSFAFTGTWDFGGGSLELPNAASGDLTLGTEGLVGLKSHEDGIAYHSGSTGEISGEVFRSFLEQVSISVDPGAWYDSDGELFLFEVHADKYPNGITIDEWKLSCNVDPDTEIDADLRYADAWIGLANAADIDEIDSSNGVSSEDTDANINGGAAVAAGKVVYIGFDADPEGTCVQMHFTMLFHAEED